MKKRSHSRGGGLPPTVLLNGIQDLGIFMVDVSGRVVVWSSGAGKLLGRPKGVGLDSAVFFNDSDRKAGKPASLLKAAAEKGSVEEEGFRVRRNGEEFWADSIVSAVRNGRKLIGFSHVVRDMTAKNNVREALVRKKIELARVDAERQNLELFTYMASHDLREPLQKIIGFGELLEGHVSVTGDAEAKDFLRRMRNAAIRMTRLMEDLTRFSKIHKQDELYRTVDLKELIEKEVLADLETRLRETGGEVVVRDIPALDGDPSQLRQLFQNLIANALKFHRPDAAPRIVIESRPAEAPFVEIAVEDNGIGFDEKYRDRIFKPFQRLHDRQTYDGSGLGLAICQKIVLNHGGFITAHSTPGKGSVFIIRLPKEKR